MTAVTPRISFYPLHPVAEEDLRQYVHEPVEALPEAVIELLPKLSIVLAPFLERLTPKGAVSVVIISCTTRLRVCCRTGGAKKRRKSGTAC